MVVPAVRAITRHRWRRLDDDWTPPEEPLRFSTHPRLQFHHLMDNLNEKVRPKVAD